MIICLLSLLLLLLVCDDRILNFTLLRFIASIIRERARAREFLNLYLSSPFYLFFVLILDSYYFWFCFLFHFSNFRIFETKKLKKKSEISISFQVFRIIGNSFYLFFTTTTTTSFVFSFPKLVIFHIIKVISIRFVDIIVRQRKIQYILE